MGKQKRVRQRPHKANPTGLISVKDFDEAAEEIVQNDREKTLQNAFDEVQSRNLEEKLSALQALASMSCDSSVAKQIAKDGIAKIIGPLLVDHNAAIRVNTASTLRDIAKNGGEDAHADLLKDDIMTPLIALMKQYYSDWQPKERRDKDIRDEKETFVQTVDLLRILCVDNEIAVKYANDEDLTSFLTKFLHIDIYGIEIALVSVQCLVCLSDENATAITEIKGNEAILLDLLDLKASERKNAHKILSLKTSITDLLINVNNPADSNWTHVLCKVLSVLAEVLVIDHRELLSSLSSILPHENNASTSEKMNKVQENRTILEAQEQALQILANLCFEDDDATDTDSEAEIEPECLDDDSMNDNLKMTSTLPIELVEVMNKCNLIDTVWQKSNPVVDKDSQEILEQNAEGKAVLKQFHDIRCAAYLCLNNLLASLELDAFGDTDHLYRKWLDIGAIIFNNQDDNLDDTDLLEAASAAMRAILQQLAETRANVFKSLTISDIQPMLNSKVQYSNAGVRVNIIRMLCNLVQILMNNDITENYEIIKYVSTFLLDVCTAETRAWVMAESIDALIDIFAEDATDRLAADIKLVPRLQSLIPQFKIKVRQQRKSSNDGKSVISTVNKNLSRFIKYKEKRIKNLT